MKSTIISTFAITRTRITLAATHGVEREDHRSAMNQSSEAQDRWIPTIKGGGVAFGDISCFEGNLAHMGPVLDTPRRLPREFMLLFLRLSHASKERDSFSGRKVEEANEQAVKNLAAG